jgi:thiamine monophosphate kinase
VTGLSVILCVSILTAGINRSVQAYGARHIGVDVVDTYLKLATTDIFFVMKAHRILHSYIIKNLKDVKYCIVE